MPNNLLKKFAKDSDKPISTVEDAWNKAKQQADEIFKDKPRDSHYWSFVNSKTQESLGLKKK
jgi:hypothetical protein